MRGGGVLALLAVVSSTGGAYAQAPPPPQPLPTGWPDRVDLIAVVEGGIAAVDETAYKSQLTELTAVSADGIAIAGGSGGLVMATLSASAGEGEQAAAALRSAGTARLQQAIGAPFMGGADPVVAHWAVPPSPPPQCHRFGFVEDGPFGAGRPGYLTFGMLLGACLILWCTGCCLLAKKTLFPDGDEENATSPLASNGEKEKQSKKDFFAKSANQQSSYAGGLSTKKASSEFLGRGSALSDGTEMGGGQHSPGAAGARSGRVVSCEDLGSALPTVHACSISGNQPTRVVDATSAI